MNYEYISDATELTRDFNAYVFGPNVPEEMKDKAQSIAVTGSQADTISQGRELLYAHRDLLNKQGKIILAQLAAYAVGNGWGGDNADGRCQKMVDGVRRDIGEGQASDWLPKEEDPAPKINLRTDGVDWRGPAIASPPTEAPGDINPAVPPPTPPQE